MSGLAKKHQKLSRKFISLFFVGCLLLVQVASPFASVYAAADLKDCTYKLSADKNTIKVSNCSSINLKSYSNDSTYTKKSDNTYVLSTDISFLGRKQDTCKSTITLNATGNSGQVSGKVISVGGRSSSCQDISGSINVGVGSVNAGMRQDERTAAIYNALKAEIEANCSKGGVNKDACLNVARAAISSCTSDTAIVSSGVAGGHSNSSTTPASGMGDLLNPSGSSSPANANPEIAGIQECLIQQPFFASLPRDKLTSAITGGLQVADKNIAEKTIKEASDSEPVDKTSCAVEGLGWIICPVMNFMAKIVDQAYNFISSLLVFQPLLTTDDPNASSKPIYDAWSSMRNFANVAFVIAFLVVIYSQISGVGVTNYGIKRLLPKIIVAAILVNISYWICAIAVDISNILGASARGIVQAPTSTKETLGQLGGSANGEGWAGITGLVLAGGLAGGAALYIGLSALLPALITALVAIITVFLVLTLRQALIVLLIVISPLAFVAYLLPNTDPWFKKWRQLFQTLLLMYPIIGLIFGASAAASTIVMASASGDYKIAIQIMGAAISIIPLAITPMVMKTAGGVLNRFGGAINNPNKGPFDRMRKGAERYKDRRKDINAARRIDRAKKVLDGNGGAFGGENSRRRRTAAWLAGSGISTSINAEKKDASAKAALDSRKQSYVANRAVSSSEYAEKIAGPTGSAAVARAYAVQTLRDERQKDIKAERVMLEGLNPGALLSEFKKDGQSSERRAAIAAEIMERAPMSDIHGLLDQIGSMEKSEGKDMISRSAYENMKRVPFGMGDTDRGALSSGDYAGEYDKKLALRAQEKMSAAALAALDPDDRKALTAMAQSNPALLGEKGMQNLVNAIKDARANENIVGNLKTDAVGDHDKILAAAGVTINPRDASIISGGNSGLR